MSVGGRYEVDAVVRALFIVSVFERQPHSRTAVSDSNSFEVHSGQYLTIRNNDSECGLSLMTLGRL
jgi:hypothetical protein